MTSHYSNLGNQKDSQITSPIEAIDIVKDKFPFKNYMTSDSYLNIANAVLKYLNPGNKILDFGCGPCDKTAVLQILGFECYAYDDLQDDWHKKKNNRNKIIAFANKCGINFKLTDEESLPFDKSFFDMIMLNDVLEHLHNSPRLLLNSLLEFAKPEGLLFITVPNAANIRKRIDLLFGNTNMPDYKSYYWYPDPWRGHIREYVKEDLLLFARFLNLEVLELRACDHMLYKLPNIIQPIYIFFTKYFNSWKDTWLLVAKKNKNWLPINSK
jgi:SAM-dependent methyltransferase